MPISTLSRYAVLVAAATILAACGSPQIAVNPAPAPAQRGTAPVSDAKRGCPDARCILVANSKLYSGERDSVLFFSVDANKDAPPVREINGSKTQLSYVIGVSMDSRNEVYALNSSPPSITVYAAGAYGNVAPARTIAGFATKLDRPDGIAIDANDKIYIANGGHYNPHITVYAAGANGNAAPIREIVGKKTGLRYPWGLAIDSASNLYVSNPGRASITVYGPSQHGNAKPIRKIVGDNTKLSDPAGIALDSSGYLYVVDGINGYDDVGVFAPGADGDVSPVRFLHGYFYSPIGIAIDAAGNAYVSNGDADDPPFLTVVPSGSKGHEASRMIGGKRTRLQDPFGIYVR
jgi:sugar lactone lactonase YvrE